jgi:hypothetical protein
LLCAVTTALFIAAPARGAVNIDATVSADRSSAATNISSPAFSTTSGNELLLAFISADNASSPNTTVNQVTGGGLTWVLVQRTNAQEGTAEIWRAFAASPLTSAVVTATLSQSVLSSITVMSFSGVDPSGTNGSGAIGAKGTGNANPGAPSATLVTTRNGSLVVGVGNDWDNAIARTPGSGQTLVHQDLAPVGDTYWVQMQSSAIPLSGTSVTINDTAPTGDRFNLSVVEVLAAPAGGPTSFTVSGTITGTGSETVTLTQGATTIATVTADASGNYSFANIANGSYTVTPAKTGFSFNPANQPVTVNGASVSVPNFTATALSFTVSGAITGTGSETVTLTQGATTIATVTADASGNYSFANIANGSYTVTPAKTGFSFNPASQNVTVNGANATVPGFTATSATFSISGTITGGGATITLTQNGATVSTVTADASGNYSFTNEPNGAYTVTPAQPGVSFLPANSSVTVNGANVTGINFQEVVLPDLSDIIPTNKMSVVQTANGLQFQYTHDTLNGGPGPFVIQPVLNQASGNYQGFQQIYSLSSSGAFTLVKSIPVAGVFIFDSDHGHFHFPFVTYGLFTVAADGGPGTPVALSSKVSFCIADSFIFEPNIPNAGALGNLGSCSDPTSLRGIDIGAVDEYDETDEGQSISLANVPDGTYWLRALVDPNNFLEESDKTNNETDVEISISGGTLTVLQTVTPVLNPPPAIAMTSPANNATISGVVEMDATTAMTSGVQFLIDGQAFGSLVSAPPFSLPWNTTTVQDGTHWLAAQTKDATGIIGTSPVVLVTVSNGGSSIPVPTLASPGNGSILSATVTLDATVASSQPIASMSFLVDLAQVGTPVTAPPYMIAWDTTTVPDGQHKITVSATDTLGNVGTSIPVTLSVNNSHPANLIGKDVSISVDGSGTITTPTFSTTTVGDLLVAFVAYDGPPNAAQTATVSGAGLNWTLLERSNTQSGTAEIWSARVDGTLSNATVSSQPGTGDSLDGSLTVIAFTNAAGTSVVGRTGAPSGPPDIPQPGVIAGDWVFAVGNDWDNAIPRTPASGQVLVHQALASVGDTYWVQSTSAPSSANALVDIHDSAPATDQWNFAAVEIVATHQ